MISPSARALARAIERRGLGAPARMLIDAHRPLGPLLSDLAVGLEPLARRFGVRWADDVISAAADPRGLDDVLAAIDDEAGLGRAESR